MRTDEDLDLLALADCEEVDVEDDASTFDLALRT